MSKACVGLNSDDRMILRVCRKRRSTREIAEEIERRSGKRPSYAWVYTRVRPLETFGLLEGTSGHGDDGRVVGWGITTRGRKALVRRRERA